jgi:uncharacterized protein involved in cysteine biosynthesis
MLLSSITWIFVSLLLIVLVHYLYSFFKNTLTIPKMRDLVNKPMERYNEIYTTINDNKSSSLPVAEDNASDMQNELKQFLQHLHTNDSQQPQQIESHSMGGGGGSAFSSYS